MVYIMSLPRKLFQDRTLEGTIKHTLVKETHYKFSFLEAVEDKLLLAATMNEAVKAEILSEKLSRRLYKLFLYI